MIQNPSTFFTTWNENGRTETNKYQNGGSLRWIRRPFGHELRRSLPRSFTVCPIVEFTGCVLDVRSQAVSKEDEPGMSIVRTRNDRPELTAGDVVEQVRAEGLGLDDLVFSDITGGAKALTIPAALVERTLA